MKKHSTLAKAIFDKEKPDKEVKRLLIKLCKKDLNYSKKTSGVDIYVGMRGAWLEAKKEK